MILVDAGPLVGMINARDPNHERCKATFDTLREPLGTVWPAVAEAMYLLGVSWGAQDRLWELIETGTLRLLPLDAADTPRMRELMKKYRDLPIDLADAALVRAAERERINRIFTLDRRHFQLYRPSRMPRFIVVP